MLNVYVVCEHLNLSMYSGGFSARNIAKNPRYVATGPDETRVDAIAPVLEFPPHCKSIRTPTKTEFPFMSSRKFVPSGYQFAVHFLTVKSWVNLSVDG
jgi:hypothetical protein